ncbi:hypothetical protein ACA910_014133 [Epithemia clementina (nom. ined.)]
MTAKPTKAPTPTMTAKPTKAPTPTMTAKPTKAPTPTMTAKPTKAPTSSGDMPTKAPTPSGDMPTKAPTPSGDMPTKAPTPGCVSAPPSSIPDALNLFEAPLPPCGAPGQMESLQGADLVNGQGNCVRINICHGTASGVNPFNGITVDRSSANLNGHAKSNHNKGTSKNPDYYPASENVQLSDGTFGKLDENCNFFLYCPEQ